ncbi:HAMP domain-containing sensor histidine kinase [Aureispira sp. CCB-E]|uniref:sensor histidine kinase n=1 Tax=Aureispira sp. CCB-E TaxID=3051121 RepID=UPI00286956F1|nr:HAMP domain-containing sensor histidine kinase [Aureispira sp. CCB-E]WMX16338.1 HAMP domain-containing sensor histidine kinase [Aureispira sp. CCB-E]
MKLLNHSVKYLSVALFILVTLWSIVFYFSMLNEIKDTIDEELENQKRLIIKNVLNDQTIITKENFDENLYTLQEIERESAILARDTYTDLEIYMQDADDDSPELEPVRMLTTVFKANDTFYQLKIANPIIEQNDLVKALFWNVVWLYLILILSIVYINNFTLKKIWQPFYRLLAQLKSYKIDQLTPLLLKETKIKEFDDLQQAVSEMNQHSLETYTQQKEFIANASHELQTPLAIASNKLELLFEDDSLSQKQAQKIAETYQILQRLVKLNKSLLLLSKIENKQFSKFEKINFNAIVKQSVGELSDYASYKGIEITVFNKAELIEKMDNTHANILISNLVKNAIFHNVENGTIEITIEKKLLKICNTGKALALDDNQVFNRFYKGGSSNRNTGLGLSIVKAILTLYNSQIHYYFKNNRHCFEIIFV